jgi:hypothetical protein
MGTLGLFKALRCSERSNHGWADNRVLISHAIGDHLVEEMASPQCSEAGVLDEVDAYIEASADGFDGVTVCRSSQTEHAGCFDDFPHQIERQFRFTRPCARRQTSTGSDEFCKARALRCQALDERPNLLAVRNFSPKKSGDAQTGASMDNRKRARADRQSRQNRFAAATRKSMAPEHRNRAPW